MRGAGIDSIGSKQRAQEGSGHERDVDRSRSSRLQRATQCHIEYMATTPDEGKACPSQTAEAEAEDTARTQARQASSQHAAGMTTTGRCRHTAAALLLHARNVQQAGRQVQLIEYARGRRLYGMDYTTPATK
jgi:hypothetical protein